MKGKHGVLVVLVVVLVEVEKDMGELAGTVTVVVMTINGSWVTVR